MFDHYFFNKDLMKTINVTPLGKLIRHPKWEDWWESEQEIKIPYFDNLGLKFILHAEESEINKDFSKAVTFFWN